VINKEHGLLETTHRLLGPAKCAENGGGLMPEALLSITKSKRIELFVLVNIPERSDASGLLLEFKRRKAWIPQCVNGLEHGIGKLLKL
jgi:hypothetical protein